MRVTSILGIFIVVMAALGCSTSPAPSESEKAISSADGTTSAATTEKAPTISIDTNKNSPKSEYLPSNQYLVGGGFDIDYTAPAEGTIILANKTNGQILVTRSVNERGQYKFRLGNASEPDKKLFGEDLSKIHLVLYFVPNKPNDAK